MLDLQPIQLSDNPLDRFQPQFLYRGVYCGVAESCGVAMIFQWHGFMVDRIVMTGLKLRNQSIQAFGRVSVLIGITSRSRRKQCTGL
jgi:hypothetical protein